jgi:hypothetical protein
MNGIGLTGRRAPASAIATIAMLGVLMAGAGAASAETARLRLDISAQKFAYDHGKVVAKGPVNGEVVREDGTTEQVTKDIELKVNPTKNCRILDLHLAKVYLNLLGLEVRTSEINVAITGDSKRALGRLFCKLSEGLKLDRDALAKRTVHSLNRRLGDRTLQLLKFSAPVRTQQQSQSSTGKRGAKADDVPPVPPGSCEVLNLMLGPLHLDLLGLVVDLYGPTAQEAVHVLVTANPNGGAIGAALCQVAGPYQEGRG